MRYFVGLVAFDLGNDFGVSYLAGVYFPVGSRELNGAFDQFTFRQDVHLSYTGTEWTAAANLIYGVVGKNYTTNLPNPDYFNYDLSLTRRFDKFEIGPIGFGSTDMSSPVGHARQSQFAVGGLVGYDFGPVGFKVYVSRDVYQRNYVAAETRYWLRVIVPLWVAPTQPEVISTRF